MVSVTSTSNVFKRDDIVVLLGAGASVDAGIPHSATMVSQIEESFNSKEWEEFRDLYNYVRSAVYYAEGIQGKFGDTITFNIERLVEALDELTRREEHPLYPFVGAWNPRLVQVAGERFERIDRFRNKIVERLRREWIEIPNYDKARYYEGLLRLQREVQHPLRVFTLNYDMCVENVCRLNHHEFPERGFDEDRIWQWQLFDDTEDREQQIILYKLHGSVDWQYDENTSRLTYSDSTSKIPSGKGALIFGTSYKLQYVDPFLFLVYQFRRLSLVARLLLIVGYGFGDEHINGILAQALYSSPEKRLVVVSPLNKNDTTCSEEQVADTYRSYIAGKLKLKDPFKAAIIVINMTAAKYFENELSLAALSALLPELEPGFDEVQT